MSATVVRAGLATLATIFTSIREVDADMPTATAQIFLLVCQNPGISSNEIAKRTSISPSAVSRHLANLSDYSSFRGRDGYGFIEMVEDRNDRRSKLVFLTQKGRTFAARLIGVLNPGVEVAATEFPTYKEFLRSKG